MVVMEVILSSGKRSWILEAHFTYYNALIYVVRSVL